MNEIINPIDLENEIINPIDLEREISSELNRLFAAEYDKAAQEERAAEGIHFREQAAVSGWTVVQHTPNLAEVDQWLQKNCQGKLSIGLYHVMFESAQDAVLFMLRWS